MKLIFYIYLLFFIISCDAVSSLELKNPLDPNNPFYESPETIITNYESLNESIIDTSSVTIYWKGNEFATEYSHNLDSTQWSDWSADTTVTLNYLNNGLHIFYVKSRYVVGIEDETPASVSFTIETANDDSYDTGVISPNGAEIWHYNNAYDITWDSSIFGQYVMIHLHKDDSIYSTISSSAYSGRYVWNLSSSIPYGQTYKICIRDLYNSLIFDCSDNYFSIEE